MPSGSGDHRFFSLFQFNSVIKSSIGWSPWRYLPKKSIVSAQQCMYVFMILMSIVWRFLNSDQSLCCISEIHTSKNNFHLFSWDDPESIIWHAPQNYHLSIYYFELQLHSLVFHWVFSYGNKPLNPQYEISVWYFCYMEVISDYIVS